AVPGDGGEGPGPARGTVPRVARGHPRLGASHLPAPDPARLPGRGGRRDRRRGGRSPARTCEGVAPLMSALDRPRTPGPTTRRRDELARGGSSLIDPQTLMRIKNLQMRARVAVEGFYRGIHRSPYHGFSVEFSEYREYSPGDDPRYLDWRLYAR